MSGTGTLIAVEPDGTWREVPNTYEGIRDGLHDVAFDYVQAGHPPQAIGCYLDDEGMLNGAPLNLTVSLIVGRPLYGPVVVTGGVDAEGNDFPPSARLGTFLAQLGDMVAQLRVGARHVGQSLDWPANPDTIPPTPVFTFDTEEEFEAWMQERHP
jgi:Domain of unknown function (DUF3846)